MKCSNAMPSNNSAVSPLALLNVSSAKRVAIACDRIVKSRIDSPVLENVKQFVDIFFAKRSVERVMVVEVLFQRLFVDG